MIIIIMELKLERRQERISWGRYLRDTERVGFRSWWGCRIVRFGMLEGVRRNDRKS